MSQRWLNTAQRALQQVRALMALFYYRKYFEWGLPTRRFVQVNIETNTICNRTCHFCLYGVKDEVPANPMPARLFFKIIDQLAEMKFVGRISLFSTNEPLTDKRIYDFIRYASLMLPSSCHSLVSNGDLLNTERLDRLFDSGLDLLLINSYDEDALERNRELVEYVRSQHSEKILHTDRGVYRLGQSGGPYSAIRQDAGSGLLRSAELRAVYQPQGPCVVLLPRFRFTEFDG
ncbi:MAG: radical SAM protein [Candidatus Competibacteraceae bacterium]